MSNSPDIQFYRYFSKNVKKWYFPLNSATGYRMKNSVALPVLNILPFFPGCSRSGIHSKKS